MHKILIPIFIGTAVALAIWGLIELKNYFDEKNQQDIANEIKDLSPAYEVTAMQLESEYDTDERAAQEKYRGEVVLVSGHIHSFGKTSSPPFIIFTSDDFVWDVRCLLPNVQVETVSSIIKSHRFPSQRFPSPPSDMILYVHVQMKGRVGSHKSLKSIRVDGCTFEQILRR